MSSNWVQDRRSLLGEIIDVVGDDGVVVEVPGDHLDGADSERLEFGIDGRFELLEFFVGGLLKTCGGPGADEEDLCKCEKCNHCRYSICESRLE